MLRFGGCDIFVHQGNFTERTKEHAVSLKADEHIISDLAALESLYGK